MKASYKVNPKVVVELDFTTQRELFEQLASLGEVFGIERCEKCKGDKIKFVVRNDKEENKYYSLDCLNEKCRARLSFGCNKVGGSLFVKRKDEDTWLPDGGWMKWNSSSKTLE